jgi:hypothetical protein
VSQQTRELIFEMLKKHAPISVPHLAQKLNMLPSTVGWQIQQLRAEKRAYVHSFSQERSKTHTRIWAVGDHPDASKDGTVDPGFDDIDDKRHMRLSEEQIEAIDDARERKRRDELLKHIRPFRDPLVWALFGGATA